MKFNISKVCKCSTTVEVLPKDKNKAPNDLIPTPFSTFYKDYLFNPTYLVSPSIDISEWKSTDGSRSFLTFSFEVSINVD